MRFALVRRRRRPHDRVQCPGAGARRRRPRRRRPRRRPRPASLQALLDAALPKIPARSGIWVKHLTTGEEGAVRADEVFNSASVIKIPVAVQALEMADAKRLDLGAAPDPDRRRRPRRLGHLPLPRCRAAAHAPRRAAADDHHQRQHRHRPRDRAGRRRGERQRLAGQRPAMPTGMKLTQTTGELFAKYNALAPDRRPQRQDQQPTSAYWLGELTPRATGRDARGDRAARAAVEGRRRGAAADDARPAVGGAAAAALPHRRRRRPQDRRFPAGAGQRRRHRLCEERRRSSSRSSSTRSPATTARRRTTWAGSPGRSSSTSTDGSGWSALDRRPRPRRRGLWIARPWVDLVVGCGGWSLPLLALSYALSGDSARQWAGGVLCAGAAGQLPALHGHGVSRLRNRRSRHAPSLHGLRHRGAPRPRRWSPMSNCGCCRCCSPPT